jgi:hypothetical protein
MLPHSLGNVNFTPYMHILVDHIPTILERLPNGNLKQFTGKRHRAW